MSFFKAMDISASGLTAQRVRMDIITQNIANVDTTRTETGAPYRRKVVTFEERKNDVTFKSELERIKMSNGQYDTANVNNINKLVNTNGVRVREISEISEDVEPFKKMYNPGHPDADEEGYVLMPNVDIVLEMTDMIAASRAYEANVTAVNSFKGMANKALEIGK